MQNRYFTFGVGNFKCVSISDGMQPIDAELLATFFAGSSPAELRNALRQHQISPEYYELQCNCLLIDTGSERVLIDSGGGPFFDPHLGQLVPGLAAAGYKPDDIDSIVFTHGHRDHVCGGIAQDGGMIFANAWHCMVRGEWEYWAKEADIEALGSAFIDDMRFARECLLAIQDQLVLIEAGDEVVSGIRTIPTAGHTRNHISVAVESAEEKLICVADTMDVPIHIEQTTWHPAWDELPEEGIRSRRMLLRRAADQEALIHGFHFPFPAVGYVRAAGAGWRFEPNE